MKFNRVVGELILVAGAIAGIATVVSAQRPAPTSQATTSPIVVQSAKIQSTEIQSAKKGIAEAESANLAGTQLENAKADSLAWLSNLIGIAQFVKNPTQYRFIFEEELGQVTDASLDEDIMTISFRYPTEGEIRTGELTGTVDSDGLFVGTYQMQSQQGMEKGDITLSFVADGTAKGRYGSDAEATRIFL